MPSKRDKTDHRKPCTLCSRPRDVLVRCLVDETGSWHFVCPGSCWKFVSGGVMDGDDKEEHNFYRYGGMWKNKHEAVSAKKPKGVGKKKEDRRIDSEGKGNGGTEEKIMPETSSDTHSNV